MSSASPPPPTSPGKRPHASDRRLSTNSLSSSAKHGTQKAQGHHIGGSKRSHTRNTSYGRALAKAGKINSTQNLGEDGARQHRKKSSNSIPTTSPRAPTVRRNNSHVALAKNSSHVNLRKNKSATAIARNLSHTQLQRKAGLGLAASKQHKDTSKRQPGFELGDMSSDEAGEDEEEEWEDSATQSPKLTRSNSAAESQPGRPTTGDQNNSAAGPAGFHTNRTSSPPEPSIRHNRSAPSLGPRASSASPAQPPDSPTNLPMRQNNPHSTKASQATSSVSAQPSRDTLPRTDSSLTHVNHADTNHFLSTTLLNTPNINKTLPDSSMPDGGVSHFLPSKATPVQRHHRHVSSGSDYDSPSSFLPTFPPHDPISPEKGGADIHGRRTALAPTSNSTGVKSRQETHNPRSASNLPSRTQQRLELQRRETMRASAPNSPATPLIADGHPRGSSAASLHSRSGSHGPNHGTDPNSATAARLMMKQDYEASEKQLGVVRRFRNPIVEAVGRLKERGLLTQRGPESGGVKKAEAKKGKGGKSDASSKTAAGAGRRSPLGKKDTPNRTPPEPSRSLSRAGGSRSGPALSGGGRKVQFRRQGSHDDIGLSRSQGSYDDPDADHDNRVGGRVAMDSGVLPEEEMMRRMWESREVYDRGEEG